MPYAYLDESRVALFDYSALIKTKGVQSELATTSSASLAV